MVIKKNEMLNLDSIRIVLLCSINGFKKGKTSNLETLLINARNNPPWKKIACTMRKCFWIWCFAIIEVQWTIVGLWVGQVLIIHVL
jgi:hypothetical protein